MHTIFVHSNAFQNVFQAFEEVDFLSHSL